MKNTYFVDGNLAAYPKLAKGTLTGAQGTTQGVNPNAAFKASSALKSSTFSTTLT